MRLPHLRRIVDIGSVSALAVAAFWAVDSTMAEHSATSLSNRLAPSAQRAIVQDRLIGSPLRLPQLAAQNALAARSDLTFERPTVLWILDPLNCISCLSSAAEFQRLGTSGKLDIHVILTSQLPKRFAYLLRALQETAVWYAPLDQVESTTGLVLPNTKLLVSPGGTVTLADARFSGQACGWSFDAQVGALFEEMPATAIRSR